MTSLYRDCFRLKKDVVDLVFKSNDYKTRTPGLLFLSKRAGSGSSGRLVFIISSKIAKANKRNLARRRVKSFFYQNKFFDFPCDSVVVVMKRSDQFSSFECLSSGMETHFGKIKRDVSNFTI